MNMQSGNADGVMQIDVLLVGLGPVGAALANLLGRYGVNVMGINQATEIFAAPRAIALDNEALCILLEDIEGGILNLWGNVPIGILG